MAKGSSKRGRGKTVDTWKEKEWYQVYAPKTFKEEMLGEIPSGNADNVMGRVIDILLYDLTKNFKHTTTKLKFKVTKITGHNCTTMFWGHELTRDFIRSLIHRGASRIDGIFNFTTADNVVYRVSTFVVTARRAKRSQMYTIRKIIYEVLDKFAKNLTHEKFIQGIIYGQFAENISNIARTIYPLRECQIRKVKVVSIPEDFKESGVIDENEQFDQIQLEMKEHGKTIKALKTKKHESEEEGAETAETSDV